MLLFVIVALIAFVLAAPVPALSQLCLGAQIDRPGLLLTVGLGIKPLSLPALNSSM